MAKDKELGLAQHLEELRSRLIKSIAVIVVCFIGVYNFVDHIMVALIKPVGELVFIAPTEAFVTRMMIALLVGIFVSSPFLIFQVWRFVSVGLKKKESKYITIFGPFSFIFFILGALFAYFLVIPLGMKFLLSFATDSITPMISMNKYVSFVGTLTLSFGLIFQLPIAILFLTKIGLVTPRFLSTRRRNAIVLIFIGAAVLTPPDVVTQCLMAIPLLILYEIGIIFSKFAYNEQTR